MYYRRTVLSLLVAAVLTVSFSVTVFAGSSGASEEEPRVEVPLHLAVLIQDDLVANVANELGVTADFIRSLPPGSKVMVAYITTGTLQVRQQFTSDLNRAARSLRIPISRASAAPFNPYIEVIEALRYFDAQRSGRNVLLLISDGLDVSRGFDATSAGHTLDIERAIRAANARHVAIYSFYAPSVGLTSRSRLAASYGQSSLNRLANETGGKAFFQGTSGFVTFDSYFSNLQRALNEQFSRAY